MYTEETVVTKFRMLLEHGIVETTKATIVYKDGVEIARQNHSCTYSPEEVDKITEDLGDLIPKEIAYLNGKWDASYRANYRAKVSARAAAEE